MKLDRLRLAGFGKFRDTVLEFKPGLNLVFGENESGKSTVLNFLRGMLFGLKKQGNRRSFEELLERYRPWGSERYFGVLEYSLDDRNFRVERNFEPKEERVRILDGVSWEDLTPSFGMDRRREVLFAPEQLGISQTIFDNTVCVRQLQTKGSDNLAGEIQAKLVNLVSAGEEDISINNALQALTGTLKEFGQSERPSRSRLGKASAKVEELERARQHTIELYEKIRSAETNRQALMGDLLALNRRSAELSIQVKIIEANQIEIKLAKIREYDRQIQDQQNSLRTDLLTFPVAEKDNLLLAQERENLARTRIKDLEEKSAALASRLEDERGAVKRLEMFSAFDRDSVLAVEKGYTKLEEALQQAEGLEKRRRELTERRRELKDEFAGLEGCAQLGTIGEAEVNSLEEQCKRLTLEVRPFVIESLRLTETKLLRRVRTKTAIAAAVLVLGAAVGLWLGITISLPMAVAGLGGFAIAIMLVALNRPDKSKLETVRQKLASLNQSFSDLTMDMEAKQARLKELLVLAEVGSVRELGEKMRQLALLEQRQQALLVQVAELEDAIAKLRQRQRQEVSLLEGRFLAPAGILAAGHGLVNREHVESFFGGVDIYLSKRAEEQNLLGQLRGLEEQKALATGETHSARGEVDRILGLAGLSSVEEFMQVWEDAIKLAEDHKAIDSLKTAKAEVLGSCRLEELEQTKETLSQELERYQPLEPMPTSGLTELKAELDSINGKIQDTKEIIANLQGITDTRLQGVKNLAEIDTDLMNAWAEKKEMLKRKKALELARETIQQISWEVQRDFSPQLNEHIGQTIASLTAGRYLSARIDQDLKLKVIVPETGVAQDISSLSLGTVDQFYLALRLALVDLIGVKFPLVMDEPFVQYDDSRLEAALQVLLDLASSRQIVLLSCHKRELNILERIAKDRCNVVHLSQNLESRS